MRLLVLEKYSSSSVDLGGRLKKKKKNLEMGGESRGPIGAEVCFSKVGLDGCEEEGVMVVFERIRWVGWKGSWL